MSAILERSAASRATTGRASLSLRHAVAFPDFQNHAVELTCNRCSMAARPMGPSPRTSDSTASTSHARGCRSGGRSPCSKSPRSDDQRADRRMNPYHGHHISRTPAMPRCGLSWSGSSTWCGQPWPVSDYELAAGQPTRAGECRTELDAATQRIQHRFRHSGA